MAKLVYKAHWAAPPKPFRKKGDKATIGTEISQDEAQELVRKWPRAFQIEGKVKAVPSDRMRREPGGKRGKADETND